MTAARQSPALFAIGAALAALGVASGGVLGGLFGGLGALIAALGFALRGQRARVAAPWLAAAGVLGALLGIAAALGGSSLAGAAAALLGSATALLGARAALLLEHAAVPLSGAGALRAQAAASADELMEFVWHATALISPPPAPKRLVADLRAAAERHRADGVLADPTLAHPRPPALEKLGLSRLSVTGAGAAELLSFESEYEPRDPEIRDAYLSVTQNRVAHAVLWRHRTPRPALLLVHGYGMGRPALDAAQFAVPWLHRGLGLDVALLVLPLHGLRAIGRRSGAGFLDAHPLWTNAGFGQAIWELRRLAGWLRREGAPAVGVYGMSLGGYATALWASLDRDLACAVPYIPAVSLPTLLGRRLSPSARRERERSGVTDALMSDVFAPHDPLQHSPRVAPEARLVIAAQADCICPRSQAEALWQHWERPAIHWHPGSHLLPLGRAATRARLAAHLSATLVAAESTPLALTRFRRR